ncbi:Monocarboxylate transporter 14 [Operophtera brumata]|uniref:Monocarboxylate transporter 14 n=1 Tax=Operophtera brumata TaxID=104452 RepID=A0A0L7LK90_OPEBR|nr:Monocarboxylate transporter 14 [Operophtera brumata]
MEHDFEPIVLKHSRTPRSKEAKDRTVRESLLSDSTSGICKGEEDSSSIGTTSFPSPDLESHNEKLLPIEEKKTKVVINDAKAKHHVNVTNNPSLRDDSDSDSETINVNIENEVKIPDGGWGWVVVLSSFVISMIADGISFSFGLLYIEFLEEFQASKSTTAWIGSLFIAVPLLSGPVMSALVDRYGCRSMTILGGIISTIGFVLASVSTSLEMMMITFGVIAGLGLGLVYVTAVVSIAYWFEKKRNLATGLGACGTGVGTFIYAPMTQYLIEEYGWRGTILLLSGTLLNLCVCGCVMRDPEWWILEQKRQRNEECKLKKSDSKSKNSSSASITTPYVFDFDAPTRGRSMGGLIRRGVAPEKVISEEAASIKRHQNLLTTKKRNKVRQRSQSEVYLPTYLTYSDKATSKDYGIDIKYPSFAISLSKRPILRANKVEENDPPVVVHSNAIQRANSEKYDNGEASILHNYVLKDPKQVRVFRKCKSESKDDKELIVKQDCKENKRDWLKKQLSVNHHYLKDLKMPKNSLSHRNAMLNIGRYRLKASSCPDIYKNSMITIDEKEENWYDDCLDCLADMFNVNLFKKMTFNLLCLGTIILFVWFIVPYFYLAEHMIDRGAFGLLFAASFTFTPSLLVKLVSLDDFTSAYGLVLLAQGIGHLIGPPLSGRTGPTS